MVAASDDAGGVSFLENMLHDISWGGGGEACVE